MNELKPCPFCGSEAETVHLRSGDDFARCTNKSCHARTRNYHEAENLAVDAWNERVEQTCKNVSEYAADRNHFKCSECGCIVMDSEDYCVSVHDEKWEHELSWSYCPNCGRKVER